MDPNRTRSALNFPTGIKRGPLCLVPGTFVPLGNNAFHDLAQWASGFCTMGKVGFVQWVLEMWSLNSGWVRLG